MENKQYSILIVDDTPSNIKYLGTILREQGYDAEFALDGIEALNWVNEKNFNLILLDIMMPNMDGYEICTKLKKDEKTKEIPVIFLTAKVTTSDIIKGFEVGGVDYITKPFNSQELLLRIKTHIELQEQKKQLLELNATKDKFFSIIAHDLINPFNALLSFSEFQGEALKNGEIEKAILYQEYIHESATKGFDLLTNLLTWGRMQTGRIEFKPKKFDIELIIKDVIEVLHNQALQKNIQIIVDNDIDSEFIADQNMISTILRNLISNSIKFSHPDSKIVVSFFENERNFVCSVKDFGIGIPEKSINKLFMIDGNLSTVGTNKEKGTGLGLILAKDFTKMHGGTIWVDSVLNSETTFYFTIPKKE